MVVCVALWMGIEQSLGLCSSEKQPVAAKLSFLSSTIPCMHAGKARVYKLDLDLEGPDSSCHMLKRCFAAQHLNAGCTLSSL